MQLITDTPLEFGYVLWQMRPPQWSLTVVLKATYDLVQDGTATLSAEQLPVGGDVHHDDDPAQSLRAESDLAILKPRGECTLVGTCYAPGAQPAAAVSVRFRVGPVSRALAVIGDRARAGDRSGVPSAPTPFRAMPLRWERSFGGPGSPQNPVGVGLAQQGGRWPMPNIEDPAALITTFDAQTPPAGTFPIARTWAARVERSGTYDGVWARTRAPWFPADFDYEYFNAAPVEQRTRGFWQGDEEIVLEHLHPTLPVVRTRLPGLRARCFLVSPGARGEGFREVALALDTLAIDADAQQCAALFRGAAEVRDDALTDVEHVFVMHEGAGEALSLEACRTRYEARLDAMAAEDQGFEPEAPEAADTTVRGLEVLQIDAAQAAALAAEVPPEPAAPAEGHVAGASPVALGAADDPDATYRIPGGQQPFAVIPSDDPDATYRIPGGQRAVPFGFAPLANIDPEDTMRLSDDQIEALEQLAHDRRSLRTEVLERRSRGEPLAGGDFTGADLSELDLSEADFTGAILVDASLRATNLTGTRFDRALLTRADLTAVQARGGSFRGAELTAVRAEGADLEGAVLDDAVAHGANLDNTRLGRASLRGAELEEARLSGADLRGAVLDGADLTRAVLPNARLNGASLVDATLYGVQADEVVLDDADVTRVRASDGANLPRSSLRNLKAAGSHWDGAGLAGADLSFSELERADFSGADLTGATLNGCNLKNARFARTNLTRVTMLKSDAFEAVFEAAVLLQADLRGSNFFSADFFRAETTAARLELANVERTRLARE